MAQFGGPKLVKALYFDNTAKDKLITGINKIADAVSSTLGASGRSVIIEDDFGNPYVTKDGVTVANSIMLMDPVENLGVSMMKQAAQQTANIAGDGTTTSIVLTQAIIDCYHKSNASDFSFRDVKEGVNKYKKHIVDFLEKKAIDVDDKMLKIYGVKKRVEEEEPTFIECHYCHAKHPVDTKFCEACMKPLTIVEAERLESLKDEKAKAMMYELLREQKSKQSKNYHHNKREKELENELKLQSEEIQLLKDMVNKMSKAE